MPKKQKWWLLCGLRTAPTPPRKLCRNRHDVAVCGLSRLYQQMHFCKKYSYLWGEDAEIAWHHDNAALGFQAERQHHFRAYSLSSIQAFCFAVSVAKNARCLTYKTRPIKCFCMLDTNVRFDKWLLHVENTTLFEQHIRNL